MKNMVALEKTLYNRNIITIKRRTSLAVVADILYR